MRRIIMFLRLPDAPSREELHALAPPDAHVPDPHLGPDGRWRGTAIVSDTCAVAIRRWDREHHLVLADLANQTSESENLSPKTT